MTIKGLLIFTTLVAIGLACVVSQGQPYVQFTGVVILVVLALVVVAFVAQSGLGFFLVIMLCLAVVVVLALTTST